MSGLISIGKILNFHGIKGEAKIGFTKGREAQIESLKKVFAKKDGNYFELNVSDVRFHKHFAIIKFKEFQTVNDVEDFKGCDLFLSKEEVEEKPKNDQIEVDGIWGKATTKKAQKVFGTKVDGIVSNQYSKYKSKNPGLSSSTFEWEKNPGKSGSSLIKAIQKLLGLKQDGYIGPQLIKAMQKWLGTTQDGSVSRPSQMVKAFQAWLNKQ